MKKFLLSIALLAVSLVCFAQKQRTSIVELQNGSVIRGILLESEEGTIKIQTADKSVFVYPESEVVKVLETNLVDKNSPVWESTVLATYACSWGGQFLSTPTSDIGLEYILDYRFTNAFFLDLGLFAVYSFNSKKETGEYLRYPYGGIYLGFGFNFDVGSHFRITPFIRGGGMVGYYDKAWLYTDWGKTRLKSNKGFGYGGFPEVGSRFSYGPVVLSASARVYFGPAKMFSPAVTVGLGYRF